MNKKLVFAIALILAAAAIYVVFRGRGHASYTPPERDTRFYMNRAQTGDQRDRLEAISKFAVAKEQRAIPVLTEIVKRDEGFVKAMAARALGQIFGSPAPGLHPHGRPARYQVTDPRQDAAVKELVTALDDEDALVMQAACHALARIGDVRAVPPLLDIIMTKGPIRAGQAAWALQYFPLPEVEEGLWKALESPEARTRNAALNALSNVMTTRSGPVLERLLENPPQGIDINLLKHMVSRINPANPKAQITRPEPPE